MQSARVSCANHKYSKMWTKPWMYKESVVICLALAFVGVLLQISVGPINWDLFAMPVNTIFLIIYILSLLAAYLLRGKIYAVRWSMTYHAAVPAVLIAGMATVVYGITCDRSTLSAWPFVLLYFWLTTILGLTTIRQLHNLLSPHRGVGGGLGVGGSFFSHLGLFIAIVAATLGSADMKKLKMTVAQDTPEWRAVDDDGKVYNMDIAIQLNHFAIEEYPPKLLVIDNETGNPLASPDGEKLAPLQLELEGEHAYEYNGHKLKVKKVLPYCAMVTDKDTVNYVAWSYSGATTAAIVSIDNRPAQWISNGSYMFPYRPIRIDDKTSLVMPQCDPKCYTSNVDAYAKSGETLKGVDIEVNKPLELDGWKIYQLSYDETKGRWSDISVLELVRDPWLPLVYAGIFMLLAGAILMFVKPASSSQLSCEGKG